MSSITGFVGLGKMGGAMAGRLLDAGKQVAVFDVNPAAVESLGARGATACLSARAVDDAAAIVFCCLPSPDISFAVATEISASKSCEVLVEMSTVGRPAMDHLLRILGKDIALLDCPISGGRQGALDGRLSAIAAGAPWSLDRLADDLDALASALGIARFHLVAAKVGGMVALHFAARHPERLNSLTVLGTPVRGSDVVGLAGYGAEVVEQYGVAHWAANGQAARLGSGMPPAAHRWWTHMMGATPASSQAGFLRILGSLDVTESLRSVACPTLVVTNGSSTGATAAITSAESVAAWQRHIPSSALLVLSSDSYHVAAADPDRAALATRAFVDQHSGNSKR